MRTVQIVTTTRGTVRVIHDAIPADVDAHPISASMSSFIRGPAQRRAVFLALAADPAARLTLAVAEDEIVGRAVVGPSFGRWQALPGVREFAIELAREWRHTGLGEILTRTALSDPAAEQEVVLAFLLPSAWDLEHEQRSLGGYAAMLRRLAERHGFRPVATDEPEVRWHEGASLLAWIGRRASRQTAEAFEQARFLERAPRAAA
jgi:acetoin utilization protein AcuA